MNAKQMEVVSTSLSNFARTFVDTFNEHFCDGNPLIGEGVVYFHRIDGVGMVTVNKCDGMWCSEVTDGDTTGIAQGFGDTPEDAWIQTKHELYNELED